MSKSLPKLAAYNRQGRHTFSHPATGPFKVIRCDVADQMRDELTKRIAELEAENERLKTIMGICSGPCHGSVGEEYIVKVHEVVAELAALKAQTCAVCAFLDSENDDTFICGNEESVIFGSEVDIGFGCNEWQARP